MQRQLLVLSVLAFVGACTSDGKGSVGESEAAAVPAAEDPAAVRQAIEAANKKAMDGFNAGSPDALFANFAADAIVMMAGMPAWRGKTAIEEGFRGMMQQMDVKDITATIEDVAVSGDLAVETGVMTMTIGPKGGKLAADTAKYVTVWKKQGDGSWKVFRDINNTNIVPKA